MSKFHSVPDKAIGLCAGRHSLPVSGYIFEDVPDVFDFDSIQRTAMEYVCSRTEWREVYGELEFPHIVSRDNLDVVVTGLTCLTAAVIAACAWYGVRLTLWHFDRETGEYRPQTFGAWTDVQAEGV